MNVRITYPGGRIDVFDTSAFASSAPFDSKNMLTDFEISLDGIEEKGLWLTANYYAAKAEYREGTTDIPAARRSRGWRFLLATADEAKDLCDVTVDGETLIVRICDSVCNMREFESAALMRIGASNDGVLERIAKLHAYMARELKNEAPAIPGIPAEVVEYALSATEAQPRKGDMRVVSEDWGDMDEVDW